MHTQRAAIASVPMFRSVSITGTKYDLLLLDLCFLYISGTSRSSVSKWSWRYGGFHRALCPAVNANSFPHFGAMNGNVLIGLKTQPDAPLANLEHGDFHRSLEANVPSNDYGFVILP